MGKDGERGGNAQMGHVVGLLVMDEGVGAGFLKVELVISGECWHGRGAAVFRSESGDEVGGHAEVGSVSSKVNKAPTWDCLIVAWQC
ncbi:hypothetical protein AAC387_Pa03g4155 [Persea americana]